jgi:hypothetical protein
MRQGHKVNSIAAKSHIKSIYRKLKIKGRRDAIFRYFEYVHRPMSKEAIKVLGRLGRLSSVSPHKS